jgi:hypothetical protein
LTSLFLSGACAGAQEVPRSLGDTWREPRLPASMCGFLRQCASQPDAALPPPCRDLSIPLFRMPTGYPTEPIGLDDYDPPSIPEHAELPSDTDDSGPTPMQVAIGYDNPYFDFRRRGDPGGVGYYRFYSQMQFLDLGRGGCSLGLQAVAPAGPESDGVANGATFFSPSIAWYHDFGDGCGIDGFVGKHVRAVSGWSGSLHRGRGLDYGLAYHRPLPTLDGEASQNLFWFVEGLGRVRPQDFQSTSRGASWEVLPGLHWRLSDSWWLSGGVVFPVGASRSDTGLWQFTCSWQF